MAVSGSRVRPVKVSSSSAKAARNKEQPTSKPRVRCPDPTCFCEWEQTLQGIFKVKCFSAVGDGVTDDTAAMQAAIDAAPTVEVPPSVKLDDDGTLGAPVYLPRGIYRVTQTLKLRRGLRFFGSGAYASVIVHDHSGVCLQIGHPSMRRDQASAE